MSGRRPARAAVLALVPLLLATCAPAGPTPVITPAADASPTPSPAMELPVPDGDTARSQVLLRSAGGAFDTYAAIGQLQGASSTCTAVLLDTGASGRSPAHAVTSGHCVGIVDANEVIAGGPADGMRVAFDWFVDVPEHRLVPVARVAWASTKATDLAILELDATVAELRGLGLRGWRPQTVTPDAGSLDVLLVGVPIGAPLVDIPETDRFLRLATCGIDASPVTVNERQWLWPASLRNDCPEVLPGNSGSAVIDRSTGGLVGVLNTTTHGSDGGTACWLGRPCEITVAGEVTLPDTSYAQPIGGLEACFGADGSFVLGGLCPLDPGRGVTTLEGAPLAVNPSAPDPVKGTPGRSSWSTRVVTDRAARYRSKSGPLASTVCADEAGYGDLVPVATPIDDPLPTTEQRLVLCVIAENQPASTAAMATAYVDTTPPAGPIELSVTGTATVGWLVEPVFRPPELSLFRIKSGPASTTDCAERQGYALYRRQPIAISGEDAPVRFCAIGYDDANNPSEPASTVLG